ncbi:uncharacterized protein DUF222 [Barrientosiimonas humi]|uniref:Uncharacterized protein DUF222 n=1 Tax=Barrientosiimonas humi TaxID=999931 RepID=A0A542XA15_9MICO|nr:HNH endonuclease [Barrientosiimonas humi]TQL32661.1 uncharacterized protein DUF222 [Barrientosiimonas humi]CAG7572652.1 hypothetical protein BH39T_PBIAJDOK_01275 [Barrientosiimonas humi]
MSSIEHTATPPDQPITTQLTHAAANARNGGDGAGAFATAQPGAGAALLGQVRDTLTALRAAPSVLHQLGEDELVDLGRAAIALTRAGESLAVEVTTEALTRGTIAGSTAASPTHWVRELGSGIEPAQAHRVATVATELAQHATLVPFDATADSGPQSQAAASEHADDDSDAGAGDGHAGDSGHGREGGEGSALVEGDPSGRALIREVVRTGLVNIRAVAHALDHAPRLQRLIPTATRAETLSWYLALGDDATDKDRRALTRRLIARFEPGDLDRSEAAAQARETLTFQHLPNGLVRLVAELSPGNAAIVQQAISHLAAPRPTPCDHVDTKDNAGQPPRTTGPRPERASTPEHEQRRQKKPSRDTGETTDQQPTGAEPEPERKTATEPDPGTFATAQPDDNTEAVAGPDSARFTAAQSGETAAEAVAEPVSGAFTTGRPGGTVPEPGTGLQPLVRMPQAAIDAGAKLYDDRTPGKRRADALMELIQHATDQLPRPARGSITGSSKAVVILDLATLQAHADPPDILVPDKLRPPGSGAPPRQAGTLPGTGRTLTGELLAPATLRTIACSAGIIPAVLDSNSQLIDLGREERLYTGHLRTAVVLRDQHCTFPGCDRPPDWCDVHHLTPWWAGGPTTLDNGALLCARHHTIVHTQLLHGTLTNGRIHWDLTPGRMPQQPRLSDTA